MQEKTGSAPRVPNKPNEFSFFPLRNEQKKQSSHLVRRHRCNCDCTIRMCPSPLGMKMNTDVRQTCTSALHTSHKHQSRRTTLRPPERFRGQTERIQATLTFALLFANPVSVILHALDRASACARCKHEIPFINIFFSRPKP